ncbi:MAG: SDR family oxidoreductase [Oscillatoriaceae cyanobacterium]
MKFQGQHAIVTGGSSGIGKATAILLAASGANISIIGRTQSKLDEAVGEIEAARAVSTQRVLAIPADVAVRDQAEAAIARAIEQLGPPHILITSAGIAHPGYFQELPIEIFEQTMAINYFGTLYCIRAALPAMVTQNKGHIVIISSGAGLIGIYGYTPYSPTKFALRGLAESLRGELKLKGINVSIVYPPDTDTPQLAEENKTKPLETKAITATAETWTAEGVGKEILRAIQDNRFAVTPGLEMTLLNRLHSILYPLLDRYFNSVIAKTRKGDGVTG